MSDSKQDERAYTVGDLYFGGIPPLIFQKQRGASSRHTSDHVPIDHVEIRNFAILEKYSGFTPPPGAKMPSGFMASLQGEIYEYASESDLHLGVNLLLRDVLKLLRLSGKLSIFAEVSVTSASSRTGRPDLWIIWASGRPIGIVEIKSPSDDPDEPNVLDDAQVLGQAFDYGRMLYSFHGQVDCFVILSTLKDWKILWSPHSDGAANATTLPASPGHTDPTPQLLPAERTLHSSELIALDDKKLLPTLMSVVEKCLASGYHSVPVIASTRSYIKLLEKNWNWAPMSEAQVVEYQAGITFALRAGTAASTDFTVLKYMTAFNDCRVWVTIAGGSKSLVVVKQTVAEEDAVYEAELWRTVNASEHAFATRVLKKPAVGMPFAYPATEINHTVVFSFDIHKWGSQDGATAGAVPHNMVAQTQRIRQLAAEKGLLDVRTAAEQAIRRFAEANVVHEDLAWRHVALLPVFNLAGTEVVDVLPVLLDLERRRTKTSVLSRTALTLMLGRLATLSEGKEFET